ncbi:amidase [Actinomadura sp. DC4]|uniref:amidase n=1 Tax=Actinomadura sp. DC4 TaxID=3055069 RepID=UPI0025B14055|nr:amidase [Actinomadura sp. DC4]MDN3352131.1 amidase [Actinomadura sp. DC4]
MAEIAHLTASEMLAAFRTGSLSPVEATEAVLARIEEADPAVNAFCLRTPDEALAAARASEKRRRRGEPLGRLDGVPVSVKDVLLTRGHPTLRGSRTIDPAGPWPDDSPAVARVREHGGVIVGKTTSPELGWKGVTDGPLTGVTRNPWDTSRTPGGSSGGAAAAVALGMAAVALGMAPLALGTDGGGSVRIPAAFTGVFAHKPTYGRVPHFPASPFGTLAHVGPITWSVEDASLLLEVVSGPDSRDWSASPPPSPEPEPDVRGLRVAFSPTLGYASVDPEVAAVVEKAVAVFAGLGARVETVDPGFADPVEAFHVLWFAGAAKSVESLTPARRAGLDPGLREICDQGERLSALDYLTATACRMELGRLMGRFHEDHDLLLTPSLPIPAFEAGREVPAGWPEPRWTSWTPFTYPFNMTQQPAASVPCGFTSAGLPVGLQVVGPRHADARVLAACRAFENARPWGAVRPEAGAARRT